MRWDILIVTVYNCVILITCYSNNSYSSLHNDNIIVHDEYTRWTDPLYLVNFHFPTEEKTALICIYVLLKESCCISFFFFFFLIHVLLFFVSFFL